ncbi:MAG TPA: hypothetical protein VGZ32_24150 [Actinocrinis sp.]|uniref:hypothetical protein n=1 Tax=Actinocrinis sp. TaxID=1920516 RepID=UPI002DDD79CD|nr:hypothetical protein [Actinocrinis sp.]HEV3173463.1 hypothetical protein [Actinocrinis sp.]
MSMLLRKSSTVLFAVAGVLPTWLAGPPCATALRVRIVDDRLPHHLVEPADRGVRRVAQLRANIDSKASTRVKVSSRAGDSGASTDFRSGVTPRYLRIQPMSRR